MRVGEIGGEKMSEPLHINLTNEFTQPSYEKGKPEVILTWNPDEFNKDVVYRIVFCAEKEKYVKEVRRENAMGEQVWVFDEAWYTDNHNGSIGGYRLCALIHFLCGQIKGGVGAAKERKK